MAPQARTTLESQFWIHIQREEASSHNRQHPALDIAEFIRTHVATDDFVIVKCDIEGAEYEVPPYLSSVSHLIDEVLRSPLLPGQPARARAREDGQDARALVATLREKGMYAHAWN